MTGLLLCADRLSAVILIVLPRGWLITMPVRNATRSVEVFRSAVLPSTSPGLVLKAAYSDNVP